MKSYLDLVPQYEKVHRKNNKISILCIILSVLLVTTIFSMADMAILAQKNFFIKTNGNYHISITGIEEDIAKMMEARIDISACGWTYQGCTGTIGEKTVSFAGANETIFTILTEMNMEDGTYPVKKNEALLNKTALDELGISIGDTITVTIPNGLQKDYCITGVLEDMGSLLKADVYGLVFSEEGFRDIADENAVDGTTFRVLFKNGVYIQRAVREIKETYGLMDNQVSENTALLGLMGQSENSMMKSLYIVAAFLAVLVLIAGTVMIAASFNTNVLERVQFYGVLRCLGASRQQVKYFVIFQGISQSIKGVPIGLIIGQIVTWCACLLLKSVSGERFSEIPLFRFCAVGLIAGAVVGFFIVLLASLSPAKKASKVSPIMAITANVQLTQNKQAVNTKLFKIETSMGIFHALSGKKNVFLMTCSFAISIILFLSFQVMVVFLNQGMPALAPSAADISVTMGSKPLEKVLVQKIGEIDGVERVFGRMEKTDLSIQAKNGEGTVTFVSYDAIQFEWAKENLLKGKISPVQENRDTVLVTYCGGIWNVGDVITVQTVYGEKQVTVAGILSTASAANRAGSHGYIVCSEKTFMDIAGDSGYTTIDIQLSKLGADVTVSLIRNLFLEDGLVSDKRLTNSEAQSSYYTGAIFIYGFLIMIALITMFHIFNSMNSSITARTKQYGIMRSIGMDTKQLYKMIASEAITYAVLGCVVGCILGIPLNKKIFQFLIADKWGIDWKIPIHSLLMIVLLCFVSVATAIRYPMKRIKKMTIVDTIKEQQ